MIKLLYRPVLPNRSGSSISSDNLRVVAGFFRDSGSPRTSKKRSLREVCIAIEVSHIVMILQLVDKFLNGFDACRVHRSG